MCCLQFNNKNRGHLTHFGVYRYIKLKFKGVSKGLQSCYGNHLSHKNDHNLLSNIIGHLFNTIFKETNEKVW